MLEELVVSPQKRLAGVFRVRPATGELVGVLTTSGTPRATRGFARPLSQNAGFALQSPHHRSPISGEFANSKLWVFYGSFGTSGQTLAIMFEFALWAGKAVFGAGAVARVATVIAAFALLTGLVAKLTWVARGNTGGGLQEILLFAGVAVVR